MGTLKVPLSIVRSIVFALLEIYILGYVLTLSGQMMRKWLLLLNYYYYNIRILLYNSLSKSKKHSKQIFFNRSELSCTTYFNGTCTSET